MRWSDRVSGVKAQVRRQFLLIFQAGGAGSNPVGSTLFPLVRPLGARAGYLRLTASASMRTGLPLVSTLIATLPLRRPNTGRVLSCFDVVLASRLIRPTSVPLTSTAIRPHVGHVAATTPTRLSETPLIDSVAPRVDVDSRVFWNQPVGVEAVQPAERVSCRSSSGMAVQRSADQVEALLPALSVALADQQ